MIAAHQVGDPGGGVGGADDGVEAMLLEQRVEALGASELETTLARGAVNRVGQRPLGLGAMEELLPEPGLLGRTLALVELDDIGEGARRCRRATRGEVSGE